MHINKKIYFLVIFICSDRGAKEEKRNEGDDETENRKIIMIVAIMYTQNGCGFSSDKQHNS